MFLRFFKQKILGFFYSPHAHELYQMISEQSRKPSLYQAFDIPDTPEGRFELLVLHLFLVLYILKHSKEVEARQLSQSLMNLFVVDLDQSLRQMYISDKKMAKSFKTLLEGFYGRLLKYDTSMAHPQELLAECLRKNIYQGLVKQGADVLYLLVSYVYHQKEHLKRQPIHQMKFAELKDKIHGTISIGI
jgi:cytochrome b pre-mRNA-processing protein 3